MYYNKTIKCQIILIDANNINSITIKVTRNTHFLALPLGLHQTTVELLKSFFCPFFLLCDKEQQKILPYENI